MQSSTMEGLEHKYIVTELGIKLHCAVMGSGPPVLLLHGFPDFWYSFRYQLRALAAAGFTAIAPDTRGCGESDIPQSNDKYTFFDIVGDLVGILKGLNITEKVFLVVHDMGVIFGWHLVRTRPELVRAVVDLGMLPGTFQTRLHLVENVRSFLGEDAYFFVFQEPGKAEAVFAKDKTAYVLKGFLTRWHEDPKVRIPKVYSDDEEAHRPLPDWLTSADLQYYADTFDRTGFTGSLNLYRNFQRSLEMFAAWGDKPLEAPAILVVATREIPYASSVPGFKQELTAGKEYLPNLQDVKVVDAGHFLHQEKHEEVNKIMIEFLKSFL